MFMYNKRYINILSVVVLLLSGLTLKAQDIHFSQFQNAMMNINPGQTGVFNGDQRFTAIIRDQWRSVPVPYLTVGAAYDQRLTSYKFRERFFGVGGSFFYDRAGDSRKSLVNLNLHGSYSQILNPRNIISGGIGMGVVHRSFDEEDLTWFDQWDGDRHRPDWSSGENFDADNILFLDLSVGINYRYQVTSRTWINIGGGAFHLTTPDQQFHIDNIHGEDTNLPVRWNGNLTSSFQLTQGIDIMINGLYQAHGTYRKLVGNGIVRLYINNQPGRHYILDLGCGLRHEDSFFPIVGFQYNNWYLSASYDINTSFFDIATDGRGGPEISVRYIYAKPTPPSEFKKCPVY